MQKSMTMDAAGALEELSLAGLGGSERADDAAEKWLPPDEHLASLLNPNSFEAEQFRVLRHLVEQKNKHEGLQVVGVTSAAVGDGKTTTALNLAGALVQAPGARILVIDADLRRPSVLRLLGMSSSAGAPGLVEGVSSPGRRLSDLVGRRRRFNLAVLGTGEPPSAPYEVLKSPRIGELLAEARQSYDYVVVDTPPAIPFPDCRLLEKWLDGFLMVVAAHRTPRHVVTAALEVFDRSKVIGLVFNGAEDHTLSKYYYSYYEKKRRNARRRL